jgi:2-dehydro-3-deoxyphosphogluconate aldolase/(4S)-4-hydroxy-2-oxoglutarate aldolase
LFIVSPVLVPDVVSYCCRERIPVFPGAFTPQEIYAAWRAGATMVKVFPSGIGGPAYFKEVKGPFNEVELLACGGVTAENVSEYFRCGASAVSFGGSVFRKELLQDKDFAAIGRAVEAFVRCSRRP